MVPPMLNTSNIAADHIAIKPSAMDRVPITAKDMRVRIPVTVKIEYLVGSKRHGTNGDHCETLI